MASMGLPMRGSTTTTRCWGGITPYVYGDSARLSTQTSYLNVPYRIQKIVPEIMLPPIGDGKGMVRISHAVDYGDIAWSLRLRSVQNTLGVTVKAAEGVKDSGTHLTAFINLPTLNYILFGLQHVWRRVRLDDWTPSLSDAQWRNFLMDILGQTVSNSDFKVFKDREIRDVLAIFLNAVVPFGVCAGSEKQGGMHEVGMSPVMLAVNHVTSMNVEGHTKDLINYWRHIELNSGDRLCFRLGMMPMPNDTPLLTATLNHFYKRIIKVDFTPCMIVGGEIDRDFFVIIPDVMPYRVDLRKLSMDPSSVEYEKLQQSKSVWYVGTTQQHYKMMFGMNAMHYFLDDEVFMRGALLQANFCPMPLDWAYEDDDMENAEGVMLESSAKRFKLPSVQAPMEAPKKRFELPSVSCCKDSVSAPVVESMVPEKVQQSKVKKQVAKAVGTAVKKSVVVVGDKE
ncbi:hypothetical protein GUITHDRAFT_121630 [Guillardia theta CCMP2712]|uniref:Uncharacterized protein n=1 Tax=Guillardia theta (strain CCMP2712) TaxID=905079 RepID=L1I7Z3_GUITC|nr:hypothetical protein GUITHDRAFT_121630 [Guillardia theta CCMP2712]EKX32207.1 hypothetical protein GUITHDRAFT_121630 [Guillardia theta CCMP2712]|eukprot:XP_005819187.1 hypothetical protein GUITHDRAFT_121630 [Guillardia theta CCMP2712]